MKLLILKVSAGSFYFLHLAHVISLSILFSDTLVMCSFRVAITQVSHCCRRTDEVTILCVFWLYKQVRLFSGRKSTKLGLLSGPIITPVSDVKHST